MSALSVAADAASRGEGAVDVVVASLPVSLAPARDAAADLVAIGGTRWRDRIDEAAMAGARGILLSAAGLVVSDGDLDERPEPGVPVVVDHPFASNPALAAARRHLERSDGRALLEVRIVAHDGDPRPRLLDAFALARAVTGTAVVDARVVTRGDAETTLRATLDGGRPAVITLTRTPARDESARVRLIDADGIVDVRVPAPATAAPAHVVVTSATGRTLAPTAYESAHRSSWRRLRDVVVEGGSPADLRDLVADIRILRSTMSG